MLKQWTLGNFKSVAENTSLQLAPLTVLAGANSSGKSTFLQSILLVAQTLKASASQQPIILNGELVRLGYLKDVLHNATDTSPFELGFTLKFSNKYLAHSDQEENQKDEDINLRMKFRSHDADNNKPPWGELIELELSNLRNELISLQKETSKFETLLDLKEFPELHISAEIRSKIQNGIFDYVIRRILYSEESWINKIYPFEWYVSLQHFLPFQILETVNATRLSYIATLQEAADHLRFKTSKGPFILKGRNYFSIDVTDFKKEIGQQFRNEIHAAINTSIPLRRAAEDGIGSTILYQRKAELLLEQCESLNHWLEQVKLELPEKNARAIGDKLLYRVSLLQTKTDEEAEYSDVGVKITDLPPSLTKLTNLITSFFTTKIYYLGPLRENPQFIYALPPYPEVTHVGLRGEFTASVLERYKDQIVTYSLPPNDDGIMEIEKAPLIIGLQKWLLYMDLLESVTTKDRGKMGTELSVRSVGVTQDLDLTSIGVGVSQTLPTLVMGLIAPEGTTFLFEQPELHLHPKVQSRMGDFLLGLAKMGKQCIVETHSEYLINRLRRRVAEDKSDELERTVQIYFVEREDGKSNFRKVDLNEYGAVEDWPKGFFDEGPNEAQLIMDAAMSKRRRKRDETKK